MATKERVRTRALSTSKGAVHAVGQGRPRKTTTKKFTDELITGKIAPPKMIADDELACEFWKTTTQILINRKQLKTSHVMVVMLYCQSSSNYFSTTDQLAAKGLITYDSETGDIKPAISTVKHQAYQQMVKAGSLLGLDPLSELRTGLIKDQEKEVLDAKSDFSRFA